MRKDPVDRGRDGSTVQRTTGGARAWKRTNGSEEFRALANSVSQRCSASTGGSTDDAVGRTELARRLTVAQIAQKSAPVCGFGAGPPLRSGACAIVNAPGVAAAILPTWTCPNERKNWTASANSARRDPKPICVRNQRIATRPICSRLRQEDGPLTLFYNMAAARRRCQGGRELHSSVCAKVCSPGHAWVGTE